ncbi:MAG: SusD/RagB family nutrient-binding outer membrane lipoprotein [Chitinophagaceae bacterium]|nr:MAG: SusD/RagB family nutrient-binding outer membrane lipoprotein [Chitinophagaceae bacterium]
MKHSIYIAAIAAVTIAAPGCRKQYEDFPVNTNRPVTVPPNLVLTGVLSDLNVDGPWSIRANQFDVCNYNYYGDQRYDWTGAELNYSALKNVVKMEEEAIRVGLDEVNPYSTLGKFARAFFFYRMTNLTGDLPLAEALQGAEVAAPKYDSQKEIYLQILQWLEEANSDMATIIAASGDGKIDGDIYFTTKSAWRKTFNAFKLRVLVSLSKKATDADLKIQQTFAAVLADPTKYPLFEDGDDNLQYIYNNFNKYPSNPDNLGFDATRYNMAATYLNNLVTLKDPRAFVTSEPATKQLASGKTPADITAYNGASSGEDLAEMSSKMSSVENADYSLRSRSRYYANYVGEPGIIVGYSEMCFNIAEAANRGWITADAETWYKNGIKSSLSFYGVPVNAAGTVTKVYPYGATNATTYNIPFDFEGSYYQQSSVKYDAGTGLQKILLQKYLAFFQNSGWEPYFNWRRTGIPTFLTGVGTGNSGRIPKRFQYPSAERTTNGTNWSAALQSQFGSTDDQINADMWLIK